LVPLTLFDGVIDQLISDFDMVWGQEFLKMYNDRDGLVPYEIRTTWNRGPNRPAATAYPVAGDKGIMSAVFHTEKSSIVEMTDEPFD
jgi:hypothetical protein